MRVSVAKSSWLSSDLSPDPADQGASVIDLDNQPLSSGAQGIIYRVKLIDGRGRTDLLAKHFHNGLQQNLVEIIRALRADPAAARSATALKALPLLLFKGTMPSGPFEGYLMRHVSGRSLEKIADRNDDQNVRAGGLLDYFRLLQSGAKERLQMCLQFVKAMETFYHLGIIHCDLKPDNVLIDLDTFDVSVIDFDGGVHAPNRSVAVAFSEDVWTDPLYFREKLRTGSTIIQATVDSERWSVACAVCHILTGREPYWFIRGEAEIAQYQRQHRWPACEALRDFPLTPGGKRYAKHFINALAEAPLTLKYLQRTFHEGYYDRNPRPTPTQLRIQLEHDLVGRVPTAKNSTARVPPPQGKATMLLVLRTNAARVPLGSSVELTWTSQNCANIALDGRPVQTSGRRSVRVSSRTEFILSAVSPSGNREERRAVVDVIVPVPARIVEIRRFQVSSNLPKPGETVRILWEVLNADRVVLEQLDGASIVQAQNLVPAIGFIDLANLRNNTIVLLRASDSIGTKAEQQLAIWVASPPRPVAKYLSAAAAFVALLITFMVWKGGAKPPMVGFYYDHASVASGEPDILHWSVQNARQVRIEPGIGITASQGQLTVYPETTTEYTLTAEGSGGVSFGKLTVQVEPQAKKTKAEKAPPPIPDPGETAVATPTRSVADKIRALQGSGQVEPGVAAPALAAKQRVAVVFTRLTVPLSGGRSCVLTPDDLLSRAEQTNGSAMDVTVLSSKPGDCPANSTVSVEVAALEEMDTHFSAPDAVRPPAPTVAAFEAVPTPVEQCAIAILRWTVQGATTVSIEPGIGNVNPSDGYKAVQPVRTLRYTLRADGPGGAVTKDVTLLVSNPTRASCGQ